MARFSLAPTKRALGNSSFPIQLASDFIMALVQEVPKGRAFTARYFGPSVNRTSFAPGSPQPAESFVSGHVFRRAANAPLQDAFRRCSESPQGLKPAFLLV